MKRVLSLIVALSMLLAVVPAAFSAGETGYSDVDGTNYETPVAILRALNIMSGYTDGGFHPYATITRAEMAVICVRMQGIFDYGDKASMDEVIYDDMDGHWAEAAVAYARSLGIIDGNTDGNFNPDEPVTYEEAIKMVVATLGYDYYAELNGGYPTGYLNIAQKLKLTNGVGLTVGAYITRGDVAKIVYNSLTANIMSPDVFTDNGNEITYNVVDGNNILNTYFDVEKLRGIVYENDRTSISGETTLKAGQVRIGDSTGEVFNAGATSIGNYLGYYVTFYAIDAGRGDERTIISYKVESSKNDYLKIDAANLENVSLSNSRYLFEYRNNVNDKKAKSVRTSTTPLVIYNGVALIDYTVSDLAPEYGQVTLIDNDNNGQYDIVDILDYDIMLVLSASETSGNVTASHSTGLRSVKADASDENYSVRIVDGAGNNVPFNKIAKNSVINAAVSRDEGQTVRTLIVSNDTVTGSVSTVTEEGYYVINGKEYDVVDYVNSTYDIRVGSEGTFYLTYDGKIAGFDGEEKLNKSIGLYISCNEGGLSAGNVIKLMKSDGSFGIYELASKVKYNGESMSGKELFAMIADRTNPLFGRHSDSGISDGKIIADPAKAGMLYKLNAQGKISEIVTSTATHGSEAAETAELNVEQRSGYSNNFYYSTKYRAFHISDNKSFVTDNTVIFYSDDKYNKTDDSQIFSVRTASSCYNNENFYYPICYFYYIDNKMYADFAVFYDNYDQESSSGWNTSLSRHSMYEKLKVVDRVVEIYNKGDSNTHYRLVYWEGGTSRTADFHEDATTLMYRDGSSTFWRRGDIVNFCRTDGKITGIASIFDDNNWNNPSSVEANGGKEHNKRYLFPSGSFERRSDSNGYGTTDLAQQYWVGRVRNIQTLKYFSTMDIHTLQKTRWDLGTQLLNEPIEGECYRMIYDGKGYISDVENVGNGAIAENQLILARKNGTRYTIGCRIAESIILYEPEDFTEVQKTEYKDIYSDYFDYGTASTAEVDVLLNDEE